MSEPATDIKLLIQKNIINLLELKSIFLVSLVTLDTV